MDPSERDRLADVLHLASRSLVAIAVRSMSAGPVEITLAQHRVLVLLEAHGALSVSAVGGKLGVDQSNASRHCARLARLGLVHRTRTTHDRRGVELTLTAAGRRQVEAVRSARRREIAHILDQMPDEDAYAVTRAFESFDSVATSLVQDSLPTL
jgi:DNA-binding MarR family transcriptional regulator